MSVLIKGIEIPKNCLECMFRMSYWKRALTPSGEIFTYGCMLNGKEINILEKRCKDCPIVEIPTPHGRLIDADELIGYLNEWLSDSVALFGFTRIINHQPIIIEAEVNE